MQRGIRRHLDISKNVKLTASTYANLLFKLPKKNNTTPVITHAALNNTFASSSGKETGMMTYPSSGIAPNVANDRNMITPVCVREAVPELSSTLMSQHDMTG